MRFASLVFLVCSTPFGVEADAFEIDIFDRHRIGFSDGQSRDIRQTITFPEFEANDKLTLNWDVLGDADPWDRSGSIHAVLPDGQQVQLGKFITGFNGTTTHSQDVSRLAPMLSGKTLPIEAHIDTWVPDAWRVIASVEVQPGGNLEDNPVWAVPAFSRDPGFGWHDAGRLTKSSQVDVPEGLESVTLSYFASGHAHSATDSNDEFSPRRHRLYIDGVEVWTHVPWRTDGPNFRSVNPTSARWDGNGDGDVTDPYPIDFWSSDFPRSGWVPGDEVAPYEIDVTDYIAPGEVHTVSLTIDDVGDGSYWRVSAYVSGTGALVAPLSGDFNLDGVVDAADYTVWRDSSGRSGAGLPADANDDGVVDNLDYAQWLEAFGSRSNGATAVPEPAAGLGLALGALPICLFTRRRAL